MKTYTPVKKTRSQLSTHFGSVEEMENFLRENPKYENGGVFHGYTGSSGVGVTLNEVGDLIKFGNEFERFEFLQTNKEYEIEEAVTYQGKPAVWVKAKSK
ncbi:hypothetical protein MLOOGBEN_06705 [Bacillus sp. EB106-08-02-XG196]|uniref:hypothetical protein n=1 Tax=Bacillus sp. EB106-08-02-XG196 TaxID=2737049 RepID=UPI0015C4DAF6|nr:hypothetical protein [Bacillus sp. EB106-08-02-XG196]NWQ40388.1 hypothetical protein [Bacillus sp. EB106-08-02-XG196]